MNELLTITEHADIFVSKTRDIKNNVISEEDRNLLFDVDYKDKKGKSRYIFSHNGKNKIKACSIVGSVSIKNGLTIEILPKFARGPLTEDSKKSYRKTLVNMIRVSNEKNFITSHSQSSKIPMGEMPLTNYIIELFTVSLLDSLRQGIYATYTKEINNSSYIRGNILVSKTMQNNFIDKSKVYISYNKQSANNLLMQVFRTLSKILIQDENLSYTARQNLHEIYLLLDGVEIINLKSEDFERVVFNRLNDKYEILFNQASFIYNKYMPFSSKVNATPFWSILFDMDYLFEKFIAYLFRKSDIKFKEQNTTDCFRNLDKIVSVRPDFVIKNVNKEVISVVDAKWKLLTYKQSLYGLNAQNFWQLFSYMNLINKNEQISGYFIVPKNSDKFEDEIEFESFIEGNKSITILNIDFSLDFEDIINSYKYKIENNKLQVYYQVADIYKTKRIFAKPMSLENIKQFEFIGFIANKTIIYLKKIGNTYQYFSTDSNLAEPLYFKPSIFKNSLEHCINNFLQLYRQKTLYFSSIDIKSKLFSDIVELSSFNERNNVIITSTDYNSKISMNLRSNEFFYFAIDFYDSFANKVKNLYHENESIINKLINDFCTLKNKEQIFNEINNYKEQLKKENKNSDIKDVLNLKINQILIDEQTEQKYEFNFEQFIEDNINKEQLVLKKLNIKSIPNNINELKSLKLLDLSSNNIKFLPSEIFLLKNLEILNISENNIKMIPMHIKEFNKSKKLKELSIYGNENIKLSIEMLWIKSLEKLIVDKTIIDTNLKIFQILEENNVKIFDQDNNDLSEYIKYCEQEISNDENDILSLSYNKNILKTCTQCKEVKQLNEFRYSKNSSGLYGYTSHCNDCDNEKSKEYGKTTRGVSNGIYKKLKKQATKNNIHLNYTREEFNDWLNNQELFKQLYKFWVNSNYEESLKPNCYKDNKHLNYDLNKIEIATSEVVIKKENEKLINGEASIRVVQFTLNGAPIKIFKSMNDAMRITGVHSGIISNYCRGIIDYGDYIWKYKTDVSEEIINKLEANANNKINLFEFTSKNELQIQEEKKSEITHDKSTEKGYKPLEEKEIEQCYSDNEDELLQLANNKDIKDELKIILFYRQYNHREIKEKIQEIILCNASTDLKNLLETKIKELVKFLENKFSWMSSKHENWIYGFVYTDNNDYIYTIKEIIAQHTNSTKIIEILSNEEERKILSSILHNFNNVDGKFLVSNEILTKILGYAIKIKNVKIALEILERKEITLKLVQEVVKNFKTYEDKNKSESSKKAYVVINLVKETIYDDNSIQDWISEIDRFNFDNYSTLSTDDKMDFAVEAQFQYYTNDLIKKFCYENDEDILVDIVTDKHNTLQIRFVLLIYILNFKNFALKEKYLFEAIKNKNNKTLNYIVNLHEKNDVSLVVKYIEENFNDIDNEILFGYAMSNNKEVYYIRERICFLTNDIDILDEFSKNREDENILLNIVFHTRKNPKFTESIKSNITKYSKETLNRIANYEEYYKFNDRDCLIAKVASSFNISNKTRYELFNKYKSDRVILESLNNESLDYDRNLSNLRNMIKNAFDMAESNNFSNQIDVSKIRL